MKNAPIFFVVWIMLLGFFALCPRPVFAFVEGEAEVFYKYSFCCEYNTKQLGNGIVVFCNTEQIKDLPTDYYAVGITLQQTDLKTITKKLGVQIVYEENSLDFECVYGYSLKIVGKSVTVYGKKINLQISRQGDNKVKIGVPLIVGSF